MSDLQGLARFFRDPLLWLAARSGVLRTVEQQAATLAEQAKLLDLAHDAIMVWDLRSGAIRFWNRGAEELYGWTAAETLGRTPQAVLNTTFPCPLSEINAELLQHERWEGELTHTRRDQSRVIVASRWALQRDPDGQPTAVLAINSDITRRKQSEAAFEHQALHDTLTGLPNRALFLDRLQTALARAERHERRVAVLFLDLDNFKSINDSLGHDAGDDLLRQIAQRLADCARSSDTVARFAGDEFTLLLEDVRDISESDQVAERIAASLRAPIHVYGRDVFISASIGVAMSNPQHNDPEILMHNADTAMYDAKTIGKGRHSVFDTRMNDRIVERAQLEEDLRTALHLGQFELYYQPIVSFASGEFDEVEALLRWERPGYGLVPPAEFIPIAEETGLIVPIGRWVLQEACRQASAWNAQRGIEDLLVVSVNLSARQFQEPGLVDDILSAAASADLDLRALKLELTESVAMKDVEGTVIKLQVLNALGVQLAIDDFGTGYSSLAYLKRFPVHTLKIDRSFVESVCDTAEDTAIVRTVVALAKAMHLQVVGEGVERRSQADQLQALGCDTGQGYYFARPQSAAAITALLGCSQNHKRSLAA